MRPTSWRTIAGASAGSAAVSLGVLRLLAASGAAAPPPGWFTHVIVLVVTAILLISGLAVRRMVDGKPTPMRPVEAAGVAVLAKTCSVVGSLLAGYFTALLLDALWLPAVPVRTTLLLAGAAGIILSALMVVVALVVERWCRVDPPDEDDGREAPAAEAA